MKKSTEVEYWVVDEVGRLASAKPLLDAHERVEEEFTDCLVEVKTEPYETIEELGDDLTEILRAVVDRAHEEGLRLVPLGTPLDDGEDIGVRPDERSEIQRRVLGDDFEYAKFCAGTHVHLDRTDVVDQLNVLTALDPAFALVNTSSHHCGERTFACARPQLYRRRCYERYPDQGQLWRYVTGVDEWESRLQRCFDEFRAAALGRGVDEAAFDAAFTPENAVWTPVRLRYEMPTIEWRSPDAALPSQVLRLTRDVADVVERIGDAEVTIGDVGRGLEGDGIDLPNFEWLQRYTDEAMERGLDSPLLSDYLRRMGFDVSDYDPLADDLQWDSLTPSEIREVRLHYADRLERDLRVRVLP